MSWFEEYYSNYGSLSVDEYVQRHQSSPLEKQRIASTLAAVPESTTSLLDIGAGHGIFLSELERVRGIAGVGIEITDEKVAYARERGVDLRKGDASELEFADASFDAVIACEVLEHLPWETYESALREISRVARRSIIVTVPYKERRALATCPYCGARTNPDYHFRSFDENVLSALFPGFDLERAQPLGIEKKSVLTQLRSYLPAPWGDFMICPSCNFRKPRQPEGPAAGPKAPHRNVRSLLRTAAQLGPRVSRARWLMGVYARRP